mmetsp:Transcript_14305/g.22279  ORF Transcript_14305/g.22279 Transcript_14305/m.22279 type:complete len:131 (-) Transcript_14305:600-992(-)
MPAESLEFDYEMARLLVTKVFDPEKDIQTSVVNKIEEAKLPQASNEQGETEAAEPTPLPLGLKLDLILLYLRRVHSYCLYCCEEYEDERMLATRCGPQHIRNCQQIPKEEFEEIAKKNDNPEEATEGEVS